MWTGARGGGIGDRGWGGEGGGGGGGGEVGRVSADKTSKRQVDGGSVRDGEG